MGDASAIGNQGTGAWLLPEYLQQRCLVPLNVHAKDRQMRVIRGVEGPVGAAVHLRQTIKFMRQLPTPRMLQDRPINRKD
jgi:hypothetical protein